MDEASLRVVAQALWSHGGQAVLVGGCVRDSLLGLDPKDIDIEVFGLDDTALRRALGELGPVKRFGASFTIYQVRDFPIDFARPRGDDFTASARCRDLTINAIGRDILQDKLLDPHGGVADLQARRLRATDAKTFGIDPLRALRVCQLAARFEMEADPALVDLCAEQDLEGVPGERARHEFDKLLDLPRAPSLGLRIFAQARLWRYFPALKAIDAALVDAAAALPQEPGRQGLMHAALLFHADIDAADAFLLATRASNALRDTTMKLLRHAHAAATSQDPATLAPWMHTRMRRFAAPDAVLGRHLLARGYTPGPEMGGVLKACRALQDETGENDAEKILARALPGGQA